MKILIIKTSSLGDIIQTFPVLSALKNLFSAVTIDWVVEESFRSLLDAHPLVNKVLTINTKSWRKNCFNASTYSEIKQSVLELRDQYYDLIIDFQGNVKSGLVLMCCKGAKKVGFGYQTISEWPNLLFTHEKINPPKGFNIREDALFFIKHLFGHNELNINPQILLKITEQELHYIEEVTNHPKKKIMLCPGSFWENKKLSETQWYQLISQYYVPSSTILYFVSGTDQELRMCENMKKYYPLESILVHKSTLPCLQNLMDKMDLLLAVDSLPLHLAGTTSTQTLSFFGPSSSTKYQPMGERHQSIQGVCPYSNHFEKRCKILRSCATGACIKNLSFEKKSDI